jgi:SAM-dependent methyltransferase
VKKVTDSGLGMEQQKSINAYFEAEAPYWKEVYELGDVWSTTYKERRSVVLELVQQLQVSTEWPTLEIGCGAGLTSVALARNGYAVEAIDSVDAMIKVTQQHAEDAGVGHRVTTSIGDVHDLAFANDMFSLVLMIGVAPWLHSLDKSLHEVARVLRPEGYLIATADNWWRADHWIDPLHFPPLRPIRRGVWRVLERFSLLKPERGPRNHHHSIRKFDAYLAAAGLEKVEGKMVGFGPFSFLGCKLLPDSSGVRVHHCLQKLANRGVPVVRSMGTQYIVVARKVRTA